MPSESLREWAPLMPGGELNSDILCEAAVTKLANGSVFFKPGGGWVLFQLGGSNCCCWLRKKAQPGSSATVRPRRATAAVVWARVST